MWLRSTTNWAGRKNNGSLRLAICWSCSSSLYSGIVISNVFIDARKSFSALLKQWVIGSFRINVRQVALEHWRRIRLTMHCCSHRARPLWVSRYKLCHYALFLTCQSKLRSGHFIIIWSTLYPYHWNIGLPTNFHYKQSSIFRGTFMINYETCLGSWCTL